MCKSRILLCKYDFSKITIITLFIKKERSKEIISPLLRDSCHKGLFLWASKFGETKRRKQNCLGLYP